MISKNLLIIFIIFIIITIFIILFIYFSNNKKLNKEIVETDSEKTFFLGASTDTSTNIVYFIKTLPNSGSLTNVGTLRDGTTNITTVPYQLSSNTVTYVAPNNLTTSSQTIYFTYYGQVGTTTTKTNDGTISFKVNSNLQIIGIKSGSIVSGNISSSITNNMFTESLSGGSTPEIRYRTIIYFSSTRSVANDTNTIIIPAKIGNIRPTIYIQFNKRFNDSNAKIILQGVRTNTGDGWTNVGEKTLSSANLVNADVVINGVTTQASGIFITPVNNPGEFLLQYPTVSSISQAPSHSCNSSMDQTDYRVCFKATDSLNNSIPFCNESITGTASANNTYNAPNMQVNFTDTSRRSTGLKVYLQAKNSRNGNTWENNSGDVDYTGQSSITFNTNQTPGSSRC
jgi:hypothetical protein